MKYYVADHRILKLEAVSECVASTRAGRILYAVQDHWAEVFEDIGVLENEPVKEVSAHTGLCLMGY